MGLGEEGAAGGPGFVAMGCHPGFHSTSIHNTGPRGGKEVGQTGLTIPRHVYLRLRLIRGKGVKQKRKGEGEKKKKKRRKNTKCP